MHHSTKICYQHLVSGPTGIPEIISGNEVWKVTSNFCGELNGSLNDYNVLTSVL